MVAAKNRVLVVDDEEIVRESYRLALSEAGYDVRTAASGRDAINACRHEAFDVMLADLKMPDMDGLEVTRTMTEQFPEVRVVIITGYPSPASAEKAASLGAVDYLHKPLSPDRLSEATAAVLRMPARSPAAAPASAAETPATERPSATVSPQPAKADLSPLAAIGLLAAAPLIGLAYVVFLPLIGFGMLFAALGLGLREKLGWGRK